MKPLIQLTQPLGDTWIVYETEHDDPAKALLAQRMTSRPRALRSFYAPDLKTVFDRLFICN